MTYRPDPGQKLLTAAECAERIHCGASSWWGIAAASAVLRRGRVKRGHRTFWKATAVALYIDALPLDTSKRAWPRVAARRAS